MLNYFNPSNTLKVINKLQKFIFALFIAVLILGLFEALVLSPEDYKQSDSVYRVTLFIILRRKYQSFKQSKN